MMCCSVPFCRTDSASLTTVTSAPVSVTIFTVFCSFEISQVMVTAWVILISRLAVSGFSTTSRVPSPENRIRYRLPLSAPAMV